MKKITLLLVLAIGTFCFSYAQIQLNNKIQLTGSGSTAKIEGVDEVLNNHDAANKIYVDTSIANALSSGGGSFPRNCNAIKTANPSSPDGVYTIDPDSLGEIVAFDAYCDMTTDGGGWTLVYRNNHDGIMQLGNPVDIGDVADLQTTSGPSAKYSDKKINAIRSTTTSAIAYRTSSLDIGQKYYHPGSCLYQQNDNSNTGVTDECMSYIASYTTSPSPSYIQCGHWGGYAGGINCWYNCAGNSGYTNVVNTQRGYTERSGITTNTSGSAFGGSGDVYSNRVLMWVK